MTEPAPKRPLSKLAPANKCEEHTERRGRYVPFVHEASSTGATKQLAAGVEFPKRALMFVISSPSGCGKTTLAHALLKQDKGLKRSVSVTTRPKRPGEVNGRDYHFVTQKKFDQMVADDAFLEHATVFDHSYGTSRTHTDEMFEAGFDVMYVIDWQGGLNLMRKARQEVVSVFILPPSMKILEKRLTDRNTDSPDVIKRRLSKARFEMSKCKHYDYIVVNDEVEAAVARLQAILDAERLKRKRQDLPKLLSKMK